MRLLNRILRQFGLRQHITDPVEQVAHIDRAIKRRCDWSQELSVYINRWGAQANEIQS